MKKTPQIPPLQSMTPLGIDPRPWCEDCGRVRVNPQPWPTPQLCEDCRTSIPDPNEGATP